MMLTFVNYVLQTWVIVGARSSLQSMHLHGDVYHQHMRELGMAKR